MKKIILFVFICLAILTYQIKSYRLSILANVTYNSNEYIINAKRDLLCLFLAYPEHVVNVDVINDDIYIVMKSGKRILYDDKKNKNEETKLGFPDIQDMMEEIYPLADISTLMDKGKNPGRIRVYELLNEVYGSSRNNIISSLKSVNSLSFNKNNNAATSLNNAMNEINSLIKLNSKISSYVYPASGTFNYRTIAGTNRLSPHTFGIAIDLASNKNDYWKWTSRELGEKRIASYPLEMVRIFEKHNFIWGGKWYLFDILHFEYRPEIIMKARFFPKAPQVYELWFDGAPLNESQKYINLIDSTIK